MTLDSSLNLEFIRQHVLELQQVEIPVDTFKNRVLKLIADIDANKIFSGTGTTIASEASASAFYDLLSELGLTCDDARKWPNVPWQKTVSTAYDRFIFSKPGEILVPAIRTYPPSCLEVEAHINYSFERNAYVVRESKGGRGAKKTTGRTVNELVQNIIKKYKHAWKSKLQLRPASDIPSFFKGATLSDVVAHRFLSNFSHFFFFI